MAAENRVHHALGDAAARQLANATKPVPQLSTNSPRWLVHFLQWLPGGRLRVSHTLPPTLEPRPTVMRPSTVAPA